jgi:hypothetical protein
MCNNQSSSLSSLTNNGRCRLLIWRASSCRWPPRATTSTHSYVDRRSSLTRLVVTCLGFALLGATISIVVKSVRMIETQIQTTPTHTPIILCAVRFELFIHSLTLRLSSFGWCAWPSKLETMNLNLSQTNDTTRDMLTYCVRTDLTQRELILLEYMTPIWLFATLFVIALLWVPFFVDSSLLLIQQLCFLFDRCGGT